jgi:hypothetical protein
MATNKDESADSRVEMQMILMIQYDKDGILLEKVKFDDEMENMVSRLSTLDQAILLWPRLAVKSNNPADASSEPLPWSGRCF